MKYIITAFFFFLSFNFLNAQTDTSTIKTVKYTPSYKFQDGLYLHFDNFKTNSPIEKSKIIATNTNRNDYNFIASLMEGKKIKIYDEMGGQIELKTKNLWGFCDNGNVYININQDFSRLPYIGSLSHFVADKLIYNQNQNRYSAYNNYNYNSYNPYGQNNTSQVELRQYLLDMETGIIKDYTLEAVEIALMKNPELHDEFMKLKRKKRRQKMFFYLRKFNERTPLLVPRK